MTGIQTYKLYKALLLHFSPGSEFNFFKYNGKIKIDVSTFERRKDRYIFEKLSIKYSKIELFHFFLANIVETTAPKWVGDLLGEEAEDYYFSWKKRHEALQYTFSQDILKIKECIKGPLVDIFDPVGQNPPFIFRLFFRKQICIETLVILDKIYSYTERHKEFMLSNIVCQDLCQFLQQYSPFVRIDISKYEELADVQ